jgi:hypothetical protein
MVAAAVAFVEDEKLAAVVYEALLPRSERIVVASMVGSEGLELHDRRRPLLAATARRWTAVQTRFKAAARPRRAPRTLPKEVGGGARTTGRDLEQSSRAEEFLAAYDRALPAERRTRTAEVWFTAAKAFAGRLDPLSKPENIAQDLDPTDEVLERLATEEQHATQEAMQREARLGNAYGRSSSASGDRYSSGSASHTLKMPPVEVEMSERAACTRITQ